MQSRGVKMKIIFDNKEELILQAKKDGACSDGIGWAERRDLKTILIECPIGFRMWALKHGYVQFAKYFDFSELDGCDIVCILIDQPQFAKKCDLASLMAIISPFYYAINPNLPNTVISTS